MSGGQWVEVNLSSSSSTRPLAGKSGHSSLEEDDLYTDSDFEFRQTMPISSIPPPSRDTYSTPYGSKSGVARPSGRPSYGSSSSSSSSSATSPDDRGLGHQLEDMQPTALERLLRPVISGETSHEQRFSSTASAGADEWNRPEWCAPPLAPAPSSSSSSSSASSPPAPPSLPEININTTISETPEPDFPVILCESGADLLPRIKAVTTAISSLPPNRLRTALEHYNPYRGFRRSIFRHSIGAIELANLDSSLFLIRSSSTPNQTAAPFPLMIADICPEPQGMGEYARWRLSKSSPAPSSSSSSNSSSAPASSSSGEVFSNLFTSADGKTIKYPDIDTLNAGLDRIKKRSESLSGSVGGGADLVLASACPAGFPSFVEMKPLKREEKLLLLSQFMSAIWLLRKGGSMVLKIPHSLSPFVQHIMYLARRSFDRICLMKPMAIAQHTGERFLVALRLQRSQPSFIGDLLFVDKKLKAILESKEDIHGLLESSVIESDRPFMAYLRRTNAKMILQQLQALRKVAACALNPHALPEGNSEMIRAQWFKKFDVPSATGQAPPPTSGYGFQPPPSPSSRMFPGGGGPPPSSLGAKRPYNEHVSGPAYYSGPPSSQGYPGQGGYQ